MEKKTHIAIVLDRSGSMSSVRNETIDMFNEQVEEIKANAEKGGETTVSLVTFGGKYSASKEPSFPPMPSPAPDPNDPAFTVGGAGAQVNIGSGGGGIVYGESAREPVEKIFVGEPVEKIQKIGDEDYVPGGLTPMYDGIGQTLEELQKMDDYGEDTAFLVVIISDGLENHSRQFTGEQIAERITNLQNTGRWTFSFIGDVPDLSEIANHLNISAGNVAAFTANAAGTQAMSTGARNATASYMAARGQGATTMSDYGDTVEESTSDEQV